MLYGKERTGDNILPKRRFYVRPSRTTVVQSDTRKSENCENVEIRRRSLSPRKFPHFLKGRDVRRRAVTVPASLRFYVIFIYENITMSKFS